MGFNVCFEKTEDGVYFKRIFQTACYFIVDTQTLSSDKLQFWTVDFPSYCNGKHLILLIKFLKLYFHCWGKTHKAANLSKQNPLQSKQTASKRKQT